MSARDKLYGYAGTPCVLPENMLDEALDAYRAEMLREEAERLPLTLSTHLAHQFTELGNPFSRRMRINYQGDDGWPATKEVSPNDIALVLRDLMRDMADEASSRPTAGGTSLAFFEPGRTYAREHHGATVRFLVTHVSDSPDGSRRAAFGWRVEDGELTWSPFDSDDLTGWTDVTTVYPVGGENAQEAAR